MRTFHGLLTKDVTGPMTFIMMDPPLSISSWTCSLSVPPLHLCSRPKLNLYSGSLAYLVAYPSAIPKDTIQDDAVRKCDDEQEGTTNGCTNNTAYGANTVELIIDGSADGDSNILSLN